MELKDILEFIGIDAKDTAEFKTKFAEKWHTPDTFFASKEFSDKMGQINGSIVSKTKAVSKAFGVDLTGKDIEGKKIEEIFELSLQRLQESNNTALEAAKTAAAGSKDDNYKALEQKHNSTLLDYRTLEDNNKKLKTDYDTATQNFNNQLKNEKLNFRQKDLLDGIKWGTDDQLRRKGFIAGINEKAKFDLDENENLIVVDRKTGAKFPNPKTHSTFLSPQEFLEKEGIDAKVIQLNNDGGKPAGGGAGTGASGWGAGQKREESSGNSGGGSGDGGNQPKGNVLGATAYQN